MFRWKKLIYEFCPFWTEYGREDSSSGKDFFRKWDTAWAFNAEVKHMVHLRCETCLICEQFLLLKQRCEEFAEEAGWEETN